MTRNFLYDLARDWQWNFQDPASPLMEGIIDLHHNIFFVLLLILGVVTFILGTIIKDSAYVWHTAKESFIEKRKKYLAYNQIIHGTLLEIIWTIIPSVILFLIAIPSFALLYSMEEVLEPQLTVKVIGNQWYWSYEYPHLNLRTDSYMLASKDLSRGELRLLAVDNPLYLPIETNIRLIITAKDVIHSFAVPSLGLKVDAVPGRLNQLACYINRTGIFYGQCSELCGVNHGFMPIEIVAWKWGR